MSVHRTNQATRLLAIVAAWSAALLLSPPAPAAVFEREWKTPGDGLLTYDDVNQREWLDLSQTLLTSQFPGTGANQPAIWESRFQYVASQLTPGGLFEGFVIAKADDVLTLAQSGGVDIATTAFAVNSAATAALLNLFGTTEQMPSILIARGFLDEVAPFPPNRRRSAVFGIAPLNDYAGLAIRSDLDVPGATLFGVYLYRPVPEPVSMGPAFSIVAALAGFRRLVRNHPHSHSS